MNLPENLTLCTGTFKFTEGNSTTGILSWISNTFPRSPFTSLVDRFRSKITGAPIFNHNMCGARIWDKYLFSPVSFDMNSYTGPINSKILSLLKSSTRSLVAKSFILLSPSGNGLSSFSMNFLLPFVTAPTATS